MPRALANAGCSAMTWFGNQLAISSARATVPHRRTDAIELDAETQLPAGFRMNAFYDLLFADLTRGAMS